MAKQFTDNGSASVKTSTNKRFVVSYTLPGQTKATKTVGMLFKDEGAAFAWVRRTLNNLGIETKSVAFTVDNAGSRR